MATSWLPPLEVLGPRMGRGKPLLCMCWAPREAPYENTKSAVRAFSRLGRVDPLLITSYQLPTSPCLVHGSGAYL